MKTLHPLGPILAAALCLPCVDGDAQTPSRTDASNTSERSEEVVSLPEFSVSGTETGQYVASETMSGSRVKEKIEKLPYVVSVVTSEFLKEFAFFDMHDEEFTMAASAFVPADSGNGGVQIRGQGALKSLRNGFSRIGTIVDAVNIDRIEIIRGPSATIYGENRPGGIVNVISKRPKTRAGYRGSLALGSYDSSEFLDYISAVQADGPSEDIPPLVRYTLSLALRRKLGTFAAADAPLPALWAHAWHYCDPRTRLPAAAERCPELAKALFELRYDEEFGAGVLLPASRTRIKMTYRPASASFGSSFVHGLDLPDVTVMTSVYEKIDQLAVRCFKELDPYSRFIWRNRDSRDSAEAKLLLPPVLWPAKARQTIQAQAATQETASALKAILGMFGIVEKFTRSQYRSLTQGLAAAGVGIEPDLRFTNEVPGVDDPVAIFSSGQGDLGDGFPTASLMVQLAAAVATADGEFSQEEAAKLRVEINRMPAVSPDGRRRLEARVSVYRIKPPGTTGLKAAIAPLDVETRLKVAEVAVGVISGTGVVERAEVKVLEKIYALLGLEAATLYSRLHGLAARPAVEGQTPVKALTGRIQLDADRIAKLKATSDEVTRKLAAIFVDEPAPVEAPPDQPSEPEFQTSNPLGLALDRAHDDLAALLFTRAQWTRAEFEEICSDKGLMPDGAIESINEAAFEKFDQPVIEGEDPLEISLHLEKAPVS